MLHGKVAVITGAGGGIGRVAAQVFARYGAKVVIGELDTARGQSVADAINRDGGQAVAIATDVAKEADVQQLIAFAVEKFGRLDCAFNNAGVAGGMGPMTDLSVADWDTPYRIDLIGVWLCMKYQIPAMLKNGGGTIVNNASNAGKAAVPNMAPYAAMKAGVISATKTAAVEFGARNIRVNAVCPGPIMTEERLAEMAGVDFKAMLIEAQMQIPLDRAGRPDEVAELAAFLCSQLSSYITGQAISIDGGMSACQ
jgi:NAD(P)-dependent dehydrogenase (short-subunit alcohol dehydrogenase family)